MRSILIVGGDDSKSIESFFNRTFQKYVDSEIFPSKTYFNDYYNSGLLNKIIYQLGFSKIEKIIGERLKAYVLEKRPSVVIIFKGMRIPSDVIHWLSKVSYLVMYNPDHPFIYSGKGSGNQNMTEAIEYYDLYLTYARDIQRELRDRDINNDRIPFGFDLTSDQFSSLSELNEIRKLCFLGNGDENRAKTLNYLAERGLPTVVYGTNWKGKLSPKIDVQPGVYGMDFWRVMRQYRVQLNIMRPHNLYSHNMRTFDIPAAGGVQLAPDTEEHREFFSYNEICLYKGLDDCYEKAYTLLNRDAREIDRIREAARQRCIDSDYSYENRAIQMLKSIENHFISKG